MEPPADASPATVTRVEEDAPGVRVFTLAVAGAGGGGFGFAPGQWVDLYAPGVPAAGGYSFISTPQQLAAAGTIELAVKRSRHPVASWLHEQCRPGDQVHVRTGGSFALRPEQLGQPLLLVAGGIGVTPLLSMAAAAVEQRLGGGAGWLAPGEQQGQRGQRGQQGQGQQQRERGPGIHLMCSAPSPAELPLLRRLLQLQRRAGAGLLRLSLFSSREPWPQEEEEEEEEEQAGAGGAADGCARHSGRPQEPHLRAAIQGLQQGAGGGGGGAAAAVQVFACGPPGFAEAVAVAARACGLPQGSVHAERWW
jgi:NAD(P)H-flavin reductase